MANPYSPSYEKQPHKIRQMVPCGFSGCTNLRLPNTKMCVDCYHMVERRRYAAADKRRALQRKG